MVRLPYAKNAEDSYAIKSLKIQLDDSNLTNLEEEVVQIEHIRKIEERLNRNQVSSHSLLTHDTHTKYQPNLEECFIDNNVQQPMQSRHGQHGSFYNRGRVTRCDESRFNNLWVDKGNFQPQHNSTTYYPNTSNNFSQPVKRFTSYGTVAK